MRIVYMGTPAYAATILEELANQHDVVAVYTRADAVRGRGKQLVPSAVKKTALQLGIPVFSPHTLRDAAVQAEIAAFSPDAICVAAYGMILPREVLEIPRFGCLNAHASLLPRWRGAAPVERAILSGDETTGVCIMRMEEGLDTGPYNVRREIAIGSMTAEELTAELALLAAQGMLTSLAMVEAGRPGWMPQDEEGITYANKIAKAEVLPAPDDDACALVRKVQASADTHPARCMMGGRGVALMRARLVCCDDSALQNLDVPALQPGDVRFAAKRLFLACARGAGEPVASASPSPLPTPSPSPAAAIPEGYIPGMVEVLEVKPDGKQVMDARAFAAGIQGIKQGAITWVAWSAE